MTHTLSLLSTCLTLVIATLSVAAPSTAHDTANVVAVHTVDGREIAGIVDSRTNDAALWLRHEEQNLVLATSVSWEKVATAAVGDESIEVADLRGRAAALASPESSEMFAEVELSAEAVELQVDESRIHAVRRAPRMRNLEIVDLHLVNLDRNIEPDGLQVSVSAIGEDGAPMAVRGNLTAELVGERRPLYVAGAEFDQLDRWSQRVECNDFVDGVATYLLRFRNTAPEWEFDLLPDAVLDVRLGAHRYGNFAASSPLLLRQFNPLRDDLQQARGTRFLPDEMWGRPPLNGFRPQDGLWPWWPR